MELLCKIAGAGKTAGESDIRYGKISGNKLFGCQEQPFLLKIFHGRTMKILTEKPLADTGTDVDDSSDFFDGKVTLEIGVDPGQQLFDPGVLKGGRSAVGKHFRLLADEEQHPGLSLIHI